MTTLQGLLLLLPVIAIFALTRRRPLGAILGMGVFSILLAGVYLLSHAPDVALVEVAVGTAFLTFYILAVRKKGKLMVVGDETPYLLYRQGEDIVGLEHEILRGFAGELGLDLEILFIPRQQVPKWLVSEDADIGAGGIVPTTREKSNLLISDGYLKTRLFHISRRSTNKRVAGITGSRALKEIEKKNGIADHYEYFSDLCAGIDEGKITECSVDLARFIALKRQVLTNYNIERDPEDLSYVFAVSPGEKEIYEGLNTYIARLRSSGELESIIERYLK
ncbi:DUF4040 domain-containing protein [Candidatus Acetothermia bacterium]|nr:DUF4040 domain-containing protein [Candidatus Acetothermia bacterium]